MTKLFVTTILLTWLYLFQCERLILTNYLANNKLAEARNLSRVVNLPNAPDIESYSGYFTVEARYNSNLFFWFFPSLKNPEKAPVILWLEGGPGASTMYSLFEQMGPLRVDKNMKVTINPNSWAQEFSMLFVDNPVGTGFSFTHDDHGYSTTEEHVADNLLELLLQFYDIFEDYKDNELYITGESYGGKYVPAIGYRLMKTGNVSGINFRGVAIGNGLTDPINMMKSTPLLKSLGLIDKKEVLEIKAQEDKVRYYYNKQDYKNASLAFAHLNVNLAGPSMIANITGYKDLYDVTLSNEPAVEEPPYFVVYLNLNETLRAIHTDVQYSAGSGIVADHLFADIIKSVEPNLTALIPHYKVMLYVGNLDAIVGVDQINGMLENPDWKYYKQYYNASKVVWKVKPEDTEIAGYAKAFDNFTMLVVRNARHTVGTDQPRSCFDLIKRFIYDIPWNN